MRFREKQLAVYVATTGEYQWHLRFLNIINRQSHSSILV